MGRLLEDPLGVAEQLDQFLGPNTYTWGEMQSIISILFNPEERQMIRMAGIWIWERENKQGPPWDNKMPIAPPNWDHNSALDRQHMADYRTSLIRGIKEAVPQGQNVTKAFMNLQEKDETPSDWLERLRKDLQQYSGNDPDTPAGQVVLKVHFDEEHEFLVDPGADCTCITKVPQGCKVSRDTVRVIGAKGEGFPVPLVKQVQIEGETKITVEDLLLVPEVGYNLLGRDLQVSLGIGVVPEEGEMKVKIMTLKEEDEDKINPSIGALEDQVGKLKIDPIKIEIINPNHPIQVRQYPISQEGRMGLKPIIDKLPKNGTLEFCMSPHNNPILPVKKGDGTFRLVQDLREVNKRTIAQFPVVSNPYILLSHIPLIILGTV
ncbi:endogenous retrovirus group k member 25 pol [Pitangus sulphuratus]|nr:endogenous retrovirus group k member 25 pol [Pitangus sulphuratus]